MPVTEIGDPRLQALFGANDPRDAGVRPTIRLPRNGLSPIAIAVGAAVVSASLVRSSVELDEAAAVTVRRGEVLVQRVGATNGS